MTSIHARIPAGLRHEVDAARRRGEAEQSSVAAETQARAPVSRIHSRVASTLLRTKLPSIQARPSPLPLFRDASAGEKQELSEDEEDHDPSKENDPSQSPSPVIPSPRSPRKNVLGKRPLSELPTPTDPDERMTESEKNIAVHQFSQNATTVGSGPPKKSPKLAITCSGANEFGRLRDETADGPCSTGSCVQSVAPSADDEKENIEQEDAGNSAEITKMPIRVASTSDAAPLRPTLRKVSNISSSRGKPQPRVGIRRL